MEGEEFERLLAEYRDRLTGLSEQSKEISEKVCGLLEEYDGESGDVRWSCRTMNTSVDDVLSDITRRLERYRSGDKAELPSVMVLALDCCERLQDTATMCREGRQDERRDLKGQITSNIGYLAHHISAMKEDGYVPEDVPEFSEFDITAEKVLSNSAELEELIAYICGPLGIVHDYLKKVRNEQFWEEESE